MFLSKIPGDPTVGGLRDKMGNCSTRRGLRVGTKFMEFPQTPRGRIFSLLGFYSHFCTFRMFESIEAVRGRLIGPKPWDRINIKFLKQKWSSRIWVWAVWV